MNPEIEELYVVRCECGKEMLISRDDLTQGKVTSCGCAGGDYFYCHCEAGTLISSTPIVTCQDYCQRN